MMILTHQPKSWCDKPDPNQARFNHLDEIDAAIESGRIAGLSQQGSLCPYPVNSDLQWHWKISYNLAMRERAP